MRLPFWATILKMTVLHLRQLDSAHAPTACTAFMYISTNCLTMNSKLYNNHAHPHILEYTCMLLPVGYPTWSLLTTTIQCSGVAPGLVLFPCGLHLRSCFWVRWLGIRCTWLSHCSRICFSCFSTGTSFTCFKTSSFLCLSHSVIPRMFHRHRI